MRTSRLLVFLALALPACSGRSLVDVVEEASACSEGDTCVFAGKTPCNCGYSVNAKDADSVNEAAAHVDCKGMQTLCRYHGEPRCQVEEGLCGWW